VILSYVLVKDYDNAQQSYRTATKLNWRDRLLERAYNAHLNHFEALIYFSAAVLLSMTAGLTPAQSGEVNKLATLFIVVRIAFNGVYLVAFNEPLSIVRSSIFWMGMIIVLNIFEISGGNPFVN
jgi:uncharacterized MAPEG superfamily protein